MLRSFKGLWRWHRRAVGGHPPSVLLPLQGALTVLNNLSAQGIDRSNMAGFCLQPGHGKRAVLRPKLAAVGSFLSGLGSLIDM